MASVRVAQILLVVGLVHLHGSSDVREFGARVRSASSWLEALRDEAPGGGKRLAGRRWTGRLAPSSVRDQAAVGSLISSARGSEHPLESRELMGSECRVGAQPAA